MDIFQGVPGGGMINIPENETLVLCSLNNATVAAFFNVYEPGDIWLKTKGCDGCPIESRQRCCGKCAFLMERGCAWHYEKGDNTKAKPFVCVVRPTPEPAISFCQQEYLCVKGTNQGKTRRVRDQRDRLSDGSTVFRSG